jgi:hypothetical protein
VGGGLRSGSAGTRHGMMGTDEASDVCGGVNRVNARRVPGQPPPRVRGLTVPPLLAGLVDSGRWRHPGDDVMRAALPWFEDPVVFLSSAGDGMAV